MEEEWRTPIIWKAQRQGKPCIILTDLAHEVMNLPVYMIQKTYIETWILPTPAYETIFYKTEYWLECLHSHWQLVFQKKTTSFFKVIEQSINLY